MVQKIDESENQTVKYAKGNDDYLFRVSRDFRTSYQLSICRIGLRNYKINWINRSINPKNRKKKIW